MIVRVNVTVCLAVEMPDKSNGESIVDNVIQEMEYNFIYSEHGVRIKDTNVLEYEIQVD